MTDELNDAREALAECRNALDEQVTYVSRVWKALGIRTYEEAAGKAIDEIVREKVDYAEALRNALQKINSYISWRQCPDQGGEHHILTSHMTDMRRIVAEVLSKTSHEIGTPSAEWCKCADGVCNGPKAGEECLEPEAKRSHAVGRLCPCADPENCTEEVPGYRCRKRSLSQCLPSDAARDAARYRYLRLDDHWGEDSGPDFHGSAWGVLGELSGSEFDAFIDERMGHAQVPKSDGPEA